MRDLYNSLAVVLAFLTGFALASWVWVVTTERVIYQHKLELCGVPK